MAVHDTMPHIDLYQPVTVEDAASLAARLRDKGWLVAGGQDTYDWLKDRVKSCDAMIDLKALDALRGIRGGSSGIEIGALTTLTEVANDPLVKEHFALLSEAAGKVASPQIRNQGTLGGNICQDTRCWYYRRGLTCYRAGGNLCYADGPQSMNREHAVFGASRCVAVTPSDTAPALVALDARMVVTSSTSSREIAAEDFFVSPAVDIERMTVLADDEILVSVRIPDTWAGADFYFEKVADRNVWDFALVSIAAAFKGRGTIDAAHLVCGGVACTPMRLAAVERALAGKPRNAQSAESVAGIASRGGDPLNHNAYKLTLMENLVTRALRAGESS